MDISLVERGLAASRTKAQALIMAGQVRVDGRAVSKVGTLVSAATPIELIAGPKFVSRGGEKLEGALDDFGVDVTGRVCLDIGASTGGFTDCLLQRGAERVYAVDVGRAQLDPKLLSDPRVVSLEKTHIASLDPATLSPRPTVAVIDVSFISLRNVLPRVPPLVAPDAIVMPMVKPQFEVGAKHLKKGVVRSPEVGEAAVSEVAAFAESLGFVVMGRTAARLKGPKGNQEFFLHLVFKGDPQP